MANRNIEDCEQPFLISTERSEDTDAELSADERRHNNNLNKLKKYVELMAYKSVAPIQASLHTKSLSITKGATLVDNSKQFYEFMTSFERGDRLRRLAAKHETITLEKLEQVLRSQKLKERKKEDVLKCKQKVYYGLLSKLELQCRKQYLNVVLKKFSNFIAKLATTMCIPLTLNDPFARMQREICCNILFSIGIHPTNQAGIYNIKERNEYEACHKLSHAMLSLIIKALNLASTRNLDDIQPIKADVKVDNYLKDRLMCAAEKKIQNNNQSKYKKVVELVIPDKKKKIIMINKNKK